MSDDSFKPTDPTSANDFNHFKPIDVYGAGNSKQANWAFATGNTDANKDRNFYSTGQNNSEQKSWGYSLSSTDTNSGNKSPWAYSQGDSKKENSLYGYHRHSDGYGMGAEAHLNYLKDEHRNATNYNWETADSSWHFDNINGHMDRSAKIDNIQNSLYSVRPNSSYGSSSWAYSNGAEQSSWAFAVGTSQSSWSHGSNNNSSDNSSKSSWAFSTENTLTGKSSEESWSFTPVGEQSVGKLRRW